MIVYIDALISLSITLHKRAALRAAALSNVTVCLTFPPALSSTHPPTHSSSDKAFLSKGYDATSHFETEIADVLSLYERITGKEADLSRGDPGAAAEAAA